MVIVYLCSASAVRGNFLVLPGFAISIPNSRIFVGADILPVGIGALALLKAIFGNPAANLQLVVG